MHSSNAIDFLQQHRLLQQQSGANVLASDSLSATFSSVDAVGNFAYNNALRSARGPKPDLMDLCTELILRTASAGVNNSTTSSNTTNAATTEQVSTQELLRCFSLYISRDVGSRDYARSVLLIYAAALVFFMQAGFAMVCAGAVRKKNVQNTMLKNLLDACGASLAFFVVGYAFAYGGQDVNNPGKSFIGTKGFFLKDIDHDYAFWLFQYAFSAASATIVAGTLAERCQMAAYLCYSLMLTGWVYPIIVHAVWSPNGFLSAHSIDPLWGVGMIDFAGSGVVHITGGVTAWVATLILGPRRGRFHDETGRKLDKARDFPGHSVALQMLGTFILWFGWYGFNCGSALLSTLPTADAVASLAAINTTLSAGTAGVFALMINLWYLERTTGEAYFDLKYAMNGVLSGLVAVTGGCGIIEPWAAVVIGAIAGLVYIVGSRGLVHFRIDDAVDAIPVHFFNGVWGLIAVGLFASPSRLIDVYGRNDHPGLFYSFHNKDPDGRLLGTQFVGMLFIIGWVMIFMFPFFIWLDWRGWFRSDPLEEIVGLDTSYHGGLALISGHDGDEVNPEYISAYKKRREEGSLRRRHGAFRSSTTGTDTAVMEAYSDHGGGIKDEGDDRMDNGEVGLHPVEHL